MKDSNACTRVYCLSCNKRSREENQLSQSSSHGKRLKEGAQSGSKRPVRAAAWVDLERIDNGNEKDGNAFPFKSKKKTSYQTCQSICLKPGQPYTIGRCPSQSQLVFHDPRVSKQHCQMLLDASLRKLYLLDGVLSLTLDGIDCLVEEFRNRALSSACCGKIEEEKEKEASLCSWTFQLKASLNGVFVNGVKITEGSVVELCAGDKVTIVGTTSKHRASSAGAEVGFLVKRICFQEKMRAYDDIAVERPFLVQSMSNSNGSHGSKRIFPLRENNQLYVSDYDDVFERANSLLKCCRRILQSKDPISYICGCTFLSSQLDDTYACSYKRSDAQDLRKIKNEDLPARIDQQFNSNASAGQQRTLPCNSLHINQSVECLQSSLVRSNSTAVDRLVPMEVKTNHSHEEASAYKEAADHYNSVVPSSNANYKKDPSSGGVSKQENSHKKFIPPPGKKFYLNLLGSTHSSSFGQGNAVSLRQLLHPVQSITRIFIATFTNDILWFLSYCEIPSHLPVTLVCHNAVKCWSTDVSSRCSMPYPDFPNLVVVYPPFPEAIAFGKDSRKQGVACHHPKLLILQREDSIRAIVSSANLNEKQWNNVTNTVWWQDFPLRNMPDYSTLFTQISDLYMHKDSNTDFAAQLAGFMAHLLTDVPSQAHWITELTKYDFSGARGYLIPSVPGIHSYRGLSVTKDMQFLHAYQCSSGSSSLEFIGSVEASVVGLGHLFRSAVDSKGLQLKKLASFLRRCEKAHGMARVVLRRNRNVPADVNAVSILVSNPKNLSEEDCVQLGFLPRYVAKWVSPLWDIGFFGFTGYVCPEEALASAVEGNGVKVQLVLHVSKGPHFQDISEKMQSEHAAAFCSLIGSVQRSTGLWRLEEVLSQYNWPEHLESDFIYGSSSIGSLVDAKFLAAFSSAAGKKSMDSFDSEESDPDWGRWNSSHELRNPSIRIAFPTIERVKNAQNGVLASKYILCMAERTWQRLKPVGILRDAVPYPSERVGHPMHTKVARRRFQSNEEGSSSFGWVYCGSHNFSAAAWGRPVGSSDASSKINVSRVRSPRLHVCNYELGILFIYPPPDSKGKAEMDPAQSLDDIILPFVVPAPKYGTTDRPATMQAMKEALAAEIAERGVDRELYSETAAEEEEEEDEEGAADFVAEEKEEEKAYADMLWSQVDSS